MPTGSADEYISGDTGAEQQAAEGVPPGLPTRTLIVGVGKRGCTVVDELIAAGSFPYTEFWTMGTDQKQASDSRFHLVASFDVSEQAMSLAQCRD
eukprot:8835044-Pyramimonas_sp.AAC.1